jgi:hypothetical protein
VINKFAYPHGPRPAIRREPLRYLDELADELGVSFGMLKIRLTQRGGPSPVIHRSNQSSRKHYYSPSEVKKWWREVGSA